jgi:hypothetical protein
MVVQEVAKSFRIDGLSLDREDFHQQRVGRIDRHWYQYQHMQEERKSPYQAEAVPVLEAPYLYVTPDPNKSRCAFFCFSAHPNKSRSTFVLSLEVCTLK